jgi:hypothetical protein
MGFWIMAHLNKNTKGSSRSAVILSRTVVTSASFAILIGGLVLCGWTFGMNILKDFGQPVATNPMTGVGLLTLGVALWLRRNDSAPRAAIRGAQCLGFAVALIG